MSAGTAKSESLGAHGSGAPSTWVTRFMRGISGGGTVLDVACGNGRNLRMALAAGYSVTGVDRDLSGVADLEGGKNLRLCAADLETGAASPLRSLLNGETFDGVIVTNYLWRPILPDIVERVAPGGVLIYETFALGNERVGRGKPSNPDFLLKPGELLEAIGPHLVAIAYEHVCLATPQSVVQRVVAVGKDHRWHIMPPAA
ncbi:MAG: class I SAM-dependent methyltransferase [Hyphomicrobiaceae bacterium]|nr:class I SAM-dependent methyltransferase [Hyphomicrobiaceae bacterium]